MVEVLEDDVKDVRVPIDGLALDLLLDVLYLSLVDFSFLKVK